jgi:hypothetical protein
VGQPKLINNQSGFGIVEIIALVVILALIGSVSYVIYKDHHKTNTTRLASALTPKSSSTTNTTLPSKISSGYPIYESTATVPSSWLTYTNSNYNFSIAHPSNWSVLPTTSKVSTVFTNDPAIKYFNVDFTNPAVPGNNLITYDYGVTVTNQTLSQVLASDESVLVNNNTGPNSAVTSSIIDTKYYTYKGYIAVQLDTQNVDKNTGTPNYNADFIVYANGNSYDFYSQNSNSGGALTDPTVLTALDSLKIN